eukprot:GHVQ01013131.1.p1 GENE.GHVQ01013131.1~~GHVQ01013131.1.p1  ORF type:complete len:141 (-),score=32.55 GHVQ01013131.1:460-882(-)
MSFSALSDSLQELKATEQELAEEQKNDEHAETEEQTAQEAAEQTKTTEIKHEMENLEQLKEVDENVEESISKEVSELERLGNEEQGHDEEEERELKDSVSCFVFTHGWHRTEPRRSRSISLALPVKRCRLSRAARSKVIL